MKLIWYLVSGEAHVGYSYNHPQNPIPKIVSPLMNWGNWKGVSKMEKEDKHPPPALGTVPESRPIYNEIEVARGPPPEDSRLDDFTK